MFGLIASPKNGLLHFIPGVAGSEWIILLVIIVILIFGAKKIPELARSLGRASGEFKKGKVEAESEVTRELKGEKLDIVDKEKLLTIAKSLGVETAGKTESQIREEITKAMMR